MAQKGEATRLTMITSAGNDIQLLGDHFIVGLVGPELLEEEAKLIRRLRPAGIILFAKNISNASSWITPLTDLVARAREAAGRDEFLVSIDHEGGKVHRLPAPVTKFPAACVLGDRAGDVARAQAVELRALGFNLSFAPVLDIHSEPENPVIGKRAFSTTPEGVAALGLTYLNALEQNGVLGCAKHFPGHGATTSDSHFVLPQLGVDRTTIELRELVPFRAAIDAGVSLIMTAHVVYPALDPDSPATLSRSILTDLLRIQLGYRGVIITDDLEMKALASLTPAEKAVRAMQAGVDILLEANPAQGLAAAVALQMAEGVAHALDRDALAEQELLSSRQRVAALFKRLADIQNCGTVDQTRLGCTEHQLLKDSFAEA
ncbi:MAG: beta-N-acetylhexosaminidase [Bdellovibrionota bacterium]